MGDNPIKAIASAARAESVMEANGNPMKGKRQNMLAYFGGKYIDKSGKEHEINALSPTSPYAYKFACRLDDKPVRWDHVQTLDPNVRMTKGMYMIKYTPKGSPDYRKGRPFKIGQDLIRWDIRVSGSREWHELCKRIPELGWIERNSTLTDDLFELAAEHQGMSVWFIIDWLRYDAKIKAQTERRAGEIYEGTFVSRKTSFGEWDRIAERENSIDVVLRNWTDVLQEINDTERLPAVQEEMLEGTGEVYGRSRDLPRDPKTGRILSREQRQALAQAQEQVQTLAVQSAGREEG